jgi:hypothetical protein
MIEDFIESAPVQTSIQVTVIGRHVGRTRKYEAKYKRSNGSTYTFTGWTMREAMMKLSHKLAYPDCNMHCCHHQGTQ